MEDSEFALYSIILGAICTIALLLFLYITRSDKKFWTIVNTQLLIMLVGYTGYEFLLAVYYYNNSSRVIQEKSATTKIADVASYVFLSFVQSAYLYHSWLRAKTILFYKNKTWYAVFDITLKITTTIIMIQPVVLAFGYIFDIDSLYDTADYLVGITGAIIFVFDCYILYSFSKFFLYGSVSIENSKYRPIAKYGIIASTAVLLTTIFYGLAILFDSIFLLFSNAIFQIPMWTFVFLKKTLREAKDDPTAAPPPLESNCLTENR